MKSGLLFVTVCVLLSAAIAAAPQVFDPAPFRLEVPRTAKPDHGRPPINYSFLSRDERLRLEGLKPGMTRKQVLEHFAADGGLISPMAERFYLRGARLSNPHKVVMVEVTFKPAAMDEATYSDPQRRNAWFRSHDWNAEDPKDVVKAVGLPYESGVAID